MTYLLSALVIISICFCANLGASTALPSTTTVISTSQSTTIEPTQRPTAECIDENSLNWKSFNNQIYLNGVRFNVKGLSWYGFETDNNNLYGLDVHDVDWYLDWMVDNGFNAIRLPFSEDFINNGAENQNAYKSVVEAAGLKGLLIMPELRSSTGRDSWMNDVNVNNNATSSAISVWETMADLLKDEYNVFIADIFNEPEDVDTDSWDDWIQFTENVADAIWSKNVKWMVAVQGTNCNSTNCASGENLRDVELSGTTFDLHTHGDNRFVWSPHVYGGDVTGNYDYSNAQWQSHWGYLVDGSYQINRAANVIGEFGTSYQGEMINWLNDLIKYLKSIDQRNAFFWALNPNTPNIGGLLKADWTSPEIEKLNALHHLQQDPSRIFYNADTGRVCIAFGGPVTTGAPTMEPTAAPTVEPTTPTLNPTNVPTNAPTQDTSAPTTDPTDNPTKPPSNAPTAPTSSPSSDPTTNPTTAAPTSNPTTAKPTFNPTTAEPTSDPTVTTLAPTNGPTPAPSATPTAQTSTPSNDPTVEPTTSEPSSSPSTPEPSVNPTSAPTTEPTTVEPSMSPTTSSPTGSPSTRKPSINPSNAPTTEPTTSTTNDGYIHIRNAPDMQEYYLSFFIDNIEDCINEIDNVQLLENGEWRVQTQHYYQPGTENGRMGGYKYSFHYNGYKFSDLLPISLRILKTNGEYISLQGIMTDITADNVFTTGKTCDSEGIDDNIGDDDDDDDNSPSLRIRNCGGSGPWWYSVQIINLNPNVVITEIKMKDASGKNDWMTATGFNPGNKCYFWSDGNKPYELPIDFQISTEDETIEGNDVITSWSGDGADGDMAKNFKNDDNISGLNSTDNSNKNGLGAIEIFIIIMCIVIVVIAIIVGIIYWRKRGDQKIAYKKNTDSIAMVATNDVDVPVVDDDDDDEDNSNDVTGQQTNILAVADDEDD